MSHRKIHWMLVMALALPQLSLASMALSEGGIGEVLIYPYYTVNNGLNTTYSVVNTTADTKAIKVRFLEGENGLEVLEFNVYLDAYDVWWGVLVPTTSTVNGHTGELSVLHVDNDNSCTPFLSDQQEFLPFIIDADTPNNDLQRSREGHIEVIEMATFDGTTAAWASHGQVGVPANCDGITNDWIDNDVYDIADEAQVSGGLFGAAAIVDVANGLTVNLPATALRGFWSNDLGSHTSPGALVPSLAAAQASTEVRVGDVVSSATWVRGIDAVSALMMSNQLSNEFSLNPINETTSEWVINFPTKPFYTNGDVVVPPFSALWNGASACEDLTYFIWDREQISDSGTNGESLSLCYSTNVIEFLRPGDVQPNESGILGSFKAQPVFTPDDQNAGTAGWMALDLTSAPRRLLPTSGDGLQGLPAIAFQFEKFTNNNATEGLTATFMSARKHVQSKLIATAKNQADQTGSRE
ncbi:hypothetical protein OS175_04155 [Marinicella sp. S1101]|uniref:hypothetical protein n=1 Tax=Marinicella marina TaxID=2996016 RepID=UPI0022608CFA|nr:hypothetical protein [Marinicella marina]MCX7553060.1 hypothetical protein [Marinicella marina]MDJ1139580.1 hypothetical protein [Marinicella marina]